MLFSIWDVRVQDFKEFVDATGYDATAGMFSLKNGKSDQVGDSWKSPGFPQTSTHPVIGVSWVDAKNFCSWLTERERKLGKISKSQSYRLPTDEEWSIAVGLPSEVGATPKDKDGKINDVYPWGRQWPPPKGAGNYAGSEAKDADWRDTYSIIEGYRDDYSRTSPVGSFMANRHGLYDMGGNVWQWCEDGYDSDQTRRVMRGASWLSNDPDFMASACRVNNAPINRNYDIGFRCVLVGESSS